jgi:hypothetical protein
MRRLFLTFIIGTFAAALIGARVAEAQQAKPVPRVAYVWIFKEGPSAPYVEAFRGRLRELGRERRRFSMRVIPC